MESGYVVELAVFQGPLDLLLHLIEKEELDITRIALAKVTDQYLDYLRRISDRDPAEMSAFVVVAVKLLWIKSQALLPRPPLSAEEEEDEGEELVRQLLAYRRYREVAQQLRSWLEEGRRAFGRLAPPPLPVPKPAELEGATLEGLLEALQQRLRELGAEDKARPLPVPRGVRLVDRARRVYTLLQTREEVYFQDLLEEVPSREGVVVTLWAVLELFKRSWITVEQEALFGRITIRRRTDTAAEWERASEWWAQLEDLD